MDINSATANPAGSGTTAADNLAQLQEIFDRATLDAVKITAARTEGNTKVDAARQRPNN